MPRCRDCIKHIQAAWLDNCKLEAINLDGKTLDVYRCPVCNATYVFTPKFGQIWVCSEPGCNRVIDTSKLTDDELWLTPERIFLRCPMHHVSEIIGFCGIPVSSLPDVFYPRTNF